MSKITAKAFRKQLMRMRDITPSMSYQRLANVILLSHWNTYPTLKTINKIVRDLEYGEANKCKQ